MISACLQALPRMHYLWLQTRKRRTRSPHKTDGSLQRRIFAEWPVSSPRFPSRKIIGLMMVRMFGQK